MKIGIIGAMDLEIKKLTTEEMTSDQHRNRRFP